MFNLKNLDFIKSDEQHGRRHYSFVGIKRRKDSKELEFWLPLGFDEFDHTNYNTVKKFFFDIYKTFKIYIERKRNIISNSRTIDRDGVYEEDGGFSFSNKDDVQSIFYGKLNSIDKIIEGYDELRIASLVKKEKYNTEINYSNLHKYIHQAIHLGNDIMYIDEMTITKSLVMPENPLIVQLFCFIYTEIKKELGEISSVSQHALELAYTFKESYLKPNSSLFEETSFNNTLIVLRDSLHLADKTAIFKDEEFWHFYDATEAFLYGEKGDDSNGILWGINNFYDLWEDMCQTFMLTNEGFKDSILFADVKGKLKNYKKLDPNPFRISLNNLANRYLRPDLVLGSRPALSDLIYIKGYAKSKDIVYSIDSKVDQDFVKRKYPEVFRKYVSLSVEDKNWRLGSRRFLTKQKYHIFEKFMDDFFKENDQYKKNLTIIDFKYMKELDYNLYNPKSVDGKGVNKIKNDIIKQLVYEWSLSKNLESNKIFSEFWICYYSEDLGFESFKKPVYINNKFFNESNIKIYKINFNILQAYYNKFYIL